MDQTRTTRRSLLRAGAGAAALGPAAGCLTAPETADAEVDATGYAAFFTLYDWAEAVTGDAMAFENPVPVGEMGHGWEPEGDLVRDVADSSAFVYLDTPEFAWAQTVAEGLEDDYPDVTVIDGLAEFSRDQLLAFDADPEAEPDRDHDWDPETVTVTGFDVVDRAAGGVAAYWHEDHWHGGVPDVPVDGEVRLGAVFEDDEGRVLPLGDDAPFAFDVRLADGASDDPLTIESTGDEVVLAGREEGRTFLVFQLVHDGEVIWETDPAPLGVDIVADPEPEGFDEFFDPHVWVDPVLAGQVVDTIADGLAETVPEHADAFTENAAAYRERLDEVHEAFEAAVADAERDTAVLAGHDAYQYLEARYGFDLHTPTGISPDEQPSQSDVADSIDVVEEHGIDTVLYDPFEAEAGEVPPIAETIVENSPATETAPLTPAEGTTAEWVDSDWGWVEQMLEVNVLSLRQALGAT